MIVSCQEYLGGSPGQAPDCPDLSLGLELDALQVNISLEDWYRPSL